MKKFLTTLEQAEQLIGKTIKWTAPAYRANEDYEGTATILQVDSQKRNPIQVHVCCGDNLGFAFQRSTPYSELHFSDEGRLISYEVIEHVTIF